MSSEGRREQALRIGVVGGSENRAGLRGGGADRKSIRKVVERKRHFKRPRGGMIHMRQ